MKPISFVAAAALAALIVTPVRAQQPSITIEDNDITIRGCVTPVRAHPATAPSLLVWSRSDIMLVTAMNADGRQGLLPGGANNRVFYWLDDDQDMSAHVGKMVEIKGELEQFERGQIEITRDGGFTDVELNLGGKKEKIRVPTTWIDTTDAPRDREFEIVGRRIDVDSVNVVGACDR